MVRVRNAPDTGLTGRGRWAASRGKLSGDIGATRRGDGVAAPDGLLDLTGLIGMVRRPAG